MIEFFMSLEPTLCIAHEAKQSTVIASRLNLFLALPELRDNEKHVHMCLHTHTNPFLIKFSMLFFADSGVLDSSDEASQKYIEI